MKNRCTVEISVRVVYETLEALERHAHQWDDNDYCSICGADGRA